MNVVVLLSTFNGAAFIAEQVRSILHQKIARTKLSLLVRDDGSTDDTIAILEALADPRVEITRGVHLGAKASYLALLAATREHDVDYLALADQDDVWLAGKLERAIAMLEEVAGPALYCSALNLVNADLKACGSFAYAGGPTFERAFITNCATGCTCVANRPLLDLMKDSPRAQAILMHDWWLYLIAVSLGKVVYDPVSHILYRQHGGNQIGRGKGLYGFFDRIRKFMRRPHGPNRLSQAREFHRLYGQHLTEAQRSYLDKLLACEVDFVARIRFVFNSYVTSERGLDHAIGLAGLMLGG